MPEIFIARRKKRKGLLLPMQGTKANPMVLFPLESVDKSELDELIRAILAKQGVTEEKDVQIIIEAVEQDSEARILVAEAVDEIKRLMEIKKKGISLISVGFRKWREAYFPAHKRFGKYANR